VAYSTIASRSSPSRRSRLFMPTSVSSAASPPILDSAPGSITIVIRSASCPSESIVGLLETDATFVLAKFAIATSCAISRILFSSSIAFQIHSRGDFYDPDSSRRRCNRPFDSSGRQSRSVQARRSAFRRRATAALIFAASFWRAAQPSQHPIQEALPALCSGDQYNIDPEPTKGQPCAKRGHRFQ
jgi:hypothetical protein